MPIKRKKNSNCNREFIWLSITISPDLLAIIINKHNEYTKTSSIIVCSNQCRGVELQTCPWHYHIIGYQTLGHQPSKQFPSNNKQFENVKQMDSMSIFKIYSQRMSTILIAKGFVISKNDGEPYGSQKKVLGSWTILLKQFDI